jgi:hypothetical protein
MEPMLERLLFAGGQPAVHSLDEVEALLGDVTQAGLVLDSAALGARTTQLGFAFALGYPLAVRRLTGDRRPLALAVTEARGNRPTDIETALRRSADGARTISGTKTFVTLADRASHCLVLCKDGDVPPAGGRVALLLVLAPLRATGVSIEMLRPLPIAPEVAHGKVTFANAAIERVFDGDGWTDYGRPFRTIEDLAVMAAALGMAFRITFQRAPALAARAVAILTALQAVEHRGFSDREAHVLLAGAIALAAPLLTDVCRAAPEEVRERLERDLPLLSIAAKAREARTDRAWQSFCALCLTLSVAGAACSPGPSLHAATTVPPPAERPPKGPRLSAGARRTCFLLDGQRAVCVGAPSTFVDLEARTEALAQRGDQLSALFAGGNVKLWNYTDVFEPPSVTLRLSASQVTLGKSHGCSLVDGRVACWGDNDLGQLGLEDAVPRAPTDEGGTVAFAKLDPSVIAIAAGDAHTCAIFNGGAVRCWGSNKEGQLGIQAGSSRGSEPGDMEMPPVPLAEPAIAIAAGASHSCALLASKRIQCWGSNLHGALGGSVNIVDVMPSLVALGPRSVEMVRAASHRTCAVLDDSTVKCWGRGDFGALGLGHTRSVGLTASDMGDDLPVVPLGHSAKIVELAMGDAHSCVLFADDRVKCWGANQSGQLGTIDRENRGDGPAEMGEHLPFADFGK